MSEFDRDIVKLNWNVPTAEWERFRDFVAGEKPGLNGYLARTLEKAMREYAGTDGFETVENKLLAMAPSTPSEAQNKIKNIPEEDYDDEYEILSQDALADAEKTKVRLRVDVLVRNDFRSMADKADDNYGVELAKAMREYRSGGRAGRLERLADQIGSDKISGENPGNLPLVGEGEGENSPEEKYSDLPHTEKLTKRMADEIDGQSFTMNEVDAAISEHSSGSDYYLREYRDLVIEEKGVVENPSTGVFLPEERVQSTVDTAVSELDGAFTESDLHDVVNDVLEGAPDATVEWYGEQVREKLDVEPHPVNPDLFVTPARATEIRESLDDDSESESDELSALQAEADAELDALMATDGGN